MYFVFIFWQMVSPAVREVIHKNRNENLRSVKPYGFVDLSFVIRQLSTSYTFCVVIPGRMIETNNFFLCVLHRSD